MRRITLDVRILEYLRQVKRSTPYEIATRFSVNRDYVVQRLRKLEKEGKIRRIGRGLYELVE